MTGNDPTDKSARRKRSRGFRAAAQAARPMLSPIAAKHGFAEPDVLIRWREIVGQTMAGLCYPVRVTYQAGPDLGATLLVQATGALAPEVEMKSPQILERINSFYGYRAISRLRLTQATGAPGRAEGFAERAAVFTGPAPLDGSLMAEAEALTTGLSNDKLRAAVTQMAAHVLSKPTLEKP